MDAGANVGVFTLLASGHVGCDSVSFEPIPDTYKALVKNIQLNHLENRTTLHNIGLGSSEASLRFTNSSANSLNRVASPDEADTIEVPVKRLDDMNIRLEKYENILLKVDVEGFETEVINGAAQLLQAPNLRAIIIELNGSAAKYGFDEEKVKEKLALAGFKIYQYSPYERLLHEHHEISKWGDAIYVRDEDFIKKRLHEAGKIGVMDQYI